MFLFNFFLFSFLPSVLSSMQRLHFTILNWKILHFENVTFSQMSVRTPKKATRRKQFNRIERSFNQLIYKTNEPTNHLRPTLGRWFIDAAKLNNFNSVVSALTVCPNTIGKSKTSKHCFFLSHFLSFFKCNKRPSDFPLCKIERKSCSRSISNIKRSRRCFPLFLPLLSQFK